MQDLTSVRRQVGHMTEAQVRPLLEEVSKQREERRGTCPDCHYNTGPNWHHCDEYEALCDANKGRIMQIVRQLWDHEKNCEKCYIESHWKEFESHCEKCDELAQLFHIYAHRLDHLYRKEMVRRFERAHGRAPADKLELATWEGATDV